MVGFGVRHAEFSTLLHEHARCACQTSVITKIWVWYIYNCDVSKFASWTHVWRNYKIKELSFSPQKRATFWHKFSLFVVISITTKSEIQLIATLLHIYECHLFIAYTLVTQSHQQVELYALKDNTTRKCFSKNRCFFILISWRDMILTQLQHRCVMLT
jgi:hypothetical protein